MSIIAIGWAMDQEVGGGSRKLILLTLADQARDCGHVWPAMKTIASRAEVQERQARKLISSLIEEYEILTRIEQRRPDGGQSSNLYLLPLTPRKQCPEECRGYGLDIAPVVPSNQARLDMPGGGGSVEPGGESSTTGEPLSSTTGERTVSKEPSKKKAPKWVFDEEEFAWCAPLTELSLVHRDQPREAWLVQVRGDHSVEWMRDVAQNFVDYYNAPDTRRLKAWKTAFSSWVKRQDVRDPDGESVSLHDNSVPRGECRCGMCRKRYGNK